MTIEFIDASTPERAREVYAHEIAAEVAEMDVEYPQRVRAAAQRIADGINLPDRSGPVEVSVLLRS